jgi:hypothetical protein
MISWPSWAVSDARHEDRTVQAGEGADQGTPSWAPLARTFAPGPLSSSPSAEPQDAFRRRSSCFRNA